MGPQERRTRTGTGTRTAGARQNVEALSGKVEHLPRLRRTGPAWRGAAAFQPSSSYSPSRETTQSELTKAPKVHTSKY